MTRSVTARPAHARPGPWPGARLAVLAGLLALPPGPAPAAELSPERRGELRHLLKHDCGSCHGLTLAGGLGPPLLPEALTGKPRALLIATVMHGRPGTAMPPWGPLLTREEAEWLVDRLLSGEAP